jgi:HPt (histidine-containing phosphotransfer) domain-containing protein
VDDRTELFPLFLSEAHARLARLVALAPRLGQCAVAAGDARRELHTLKGGCRLMGLAELGDLCAQGEDLMETVGDATPVQVAAFAERFHGLLAALEAESRVGK